MPSVQGMPQLVDYQLNVHFWARVEAASNGHHQTTRSILSDRSDKSKHNESKGPIGYTETKAFKSSEFHQNAVPGNQQLQR